MSTDAKTKTENPTASKTVNSGTATSNGVNTKVEAKTEAKKEEPKTEAATSEVPAKEKLVLEGNGLKVRNAFKKVYLLSKQKLSFRSATDTTPDNVGEQKSGGKVFPAGSPEAQKIATANYYSTITSKILRNGNEEKHKSAIDLVTAFVKETTVKTKDGKDIDKDLSLVAQSEKGQSLLDAIMTIYKGGKKGLPKRVPVALTLEDIFA